MRERWSSWVLWKWNSMSHWIRREFNELFNIDSLSSLLISELALEKVLADVKTICSIYDIAAQLRDSKGNVIWLRADQSGFIIWIALLCFEICGEQDLLIMYLDVEWKEILVILLPEIPDEVLQKADLFWIIRYYMLSANFHCICVAQMAIQGTYQYEADTQVEHK